MVANPNSNLVFDFPDPTPRFEFNDPPSSRGGSPRRGGGINGGIGGVGAGGSSGASTVKKGKRFGKFGMGGKNKGGNGGGGNRDASPSKKLGGLDVSTATSNTSPNSSLNSSLDSGSSPARLKKSHSGDMAAGPSQSPPKAAGGVGGPHFALDPGPTPSSKLNLPGGASSRPAPSTLAAAGGGGHRRNPSSANSVAAGSASGYISEVSEFSFDRVTVTTNETGVTGQSSNVSWNFLDENVAGAGGGQRGPRCDPDLFLPYTGDNPAVAPGTGLAAAEAGLGNSRRTVKAGHAKKVSNSTFDNVSLSDDEEMDNIPFTGIVKGSDQSVISEISERTGGALGGMNDANDAVKALLREGMESARAKHRAAKMGGVPEEKYGRYNSLAESAADGNVKGGKDSPSRETRATAKLTESSESERDGPTSPSSKSGDLLEDLQRTYARYKTRRNGKEKSGVMQSIMEDVQFCGFYFCGIDTTLNDDKNDPYEDAVRAKKEERKRETDDTFLGKVIRCGNDMNCGGGAPFCVAL